MTIVYIILISLGIAIVGKLIVFIAVQVIGEPKSKFK